MGGMRIREAEQADGERMAEWVQTTRQNRLDPAIATYERLYTFAVEDENGPLLYVPVHPVLAIESVAARPGIEPRQYIEGLLAAKKATEDLARQYGIREIYTSSTYAPMKKALQRHGYTPVTGALRKKI